MEDARFTSPAAMRGCAPVFPSEATSSSNSMSPTAMSNLH